jgi:hypothetical protein
MEMNMSVGPDVSDMTICASCIDPRVRTLLGHTRLYNLRLLSYVRERDVCSYAINDSGLILVQPDITLLEPCLRLTN